ncbi:glycosyltransferase family 2 protein [Proteus terrae]|uniref:glycosyltransferase family 2 protein n=2 Tax=Proteus terrae TaxID=1574161 RepID=UPI000C16F9B8|nr:glycosyltransferase family 2 protein [Proteus terrae]
MKKFAYIIPTYNREDNLIETIKSIINNCNSSSYEIIIVDDGSTDNTQSKINELKNTDFIKYIKKNNSGVSDSRNLGEQHSNSEWIIFLDSDDVVIKDQLSLFEEYIEKYPNAELLFTSYQYWNSNNQNVIPRENLAFGCYNSFFDDFIRGIQPCFPGCVCIKRNQFQNSLKFISKCNFGEDQALWVDLFYKLNCISIPEITLNYRIDSQNSLSKKKIKNLPPDISVAYSFGLHKYVAFRLSSFLLKAVKELNYTLLINTLIYIIKSPNIIYPSLSFTIKKLFKKLFK